MNVKTHRVIIGRKLGHQRFELNGAGRVTYLTPETVVDDRVRTYLDAGQCDAILADLEPGPAGGAPCYVAIRVRELKPSPDDYERYHLILERFKRAGVAVDAPDASVCFAAPDFPFWDPLSTILDRFVATQAIFPTSWWDDDPERGVQEMVSLISELKIRGRFPRARMLRQARLDLGNSSDTDADDARDRLCGALVAAANDLVEKADGLRRFCGPFDHDGDPTWIYFDPDGYAALVREGLLEPWLRRVKNVVEYRRPPDLGEIDLDHFPSGDDPF
ncbi:hypothetical protein [Sorangium sp. So ce363]|uniref:hypothetical protein n=1 Tax=Sorangium sp. So ce363 TaxID=3133304 RepID=UPI003F60AD6A